MRSRKAVMAPTMLVIALVLAVLAPPLGQAANAAVPVVGPVSLGTATLSTSEGVQTLTLSGSIAIGGSEFDGTATGHPSVFDPGTDAIANLIAPFALAGPGLTGTCSGHWLLSPAANLPVSPVVEASLSCTLQLGAAAPVESGLSLLMVVSGTNQWSGIFGPGPSSLPTPAPISVGAVDRFGWGVGDTGVTHYDLVGNITFGGRVFKGDASGEYTTFENSGPPSFALTGASPSGDLAADCSDNSLQSIGVPALFIELSCTGHVGTGPSGSTSLLLAVPVETERFINPCGACASGDDTGVFFGAG